MTNFLQPKKVISETAIVEGSVAVDFGFGNGTFLELLSREVGDGGEVYAIDIQEDIITRVKKDFEEKEIENVSFIVADLEEEKAIKLKDSSVDFILISSLFFQLENKEFVAKEAGRILKPNGKILFIDWKESFKGLGPDSSLIFSEREAIKLFKDLSFELERRVSSGEYHYALIFRKI